MEDVLVLVLRNKTDKSGAVEREVLGRALELEEIGEEARRLVQFSMCSVVHEIGESCVLTDGSVHIWLHISSPKVQ